jgi:hypothetical protein
MIKFMVIAGLVWAVTTSAHAMTQAPIARQSGSLTTLAAYSCGAGRTRINGVCVARTTVRQARRRVRRYGGLCRSWRY